MSALLLLATSVLYTGSHGQSVSYDSQKQECRFSWGEDLWQVDGSIVMRRDRIVIRTSYYGKVPRIVQIVADDGTKLTSGGYDVPRELVLMNFSRRNSMNFFNSFMKTGSARVEDETGKRLLRFEVPGSLSGARVAFNNCVSQNLDK